MNGAAFGTGLSSVNGQTMSVLADTNSVQDPSPNVQTRLWTRTVKEKGVRS